MEVSPPLSPGTPPVHLRECIEELLKFTLELFIDGTLEYDLGLSKDCCFSLLKHDLGDDDIDSNPTSYRANAFEGVPRYPLYKHIASSLFQAIMSGEFSKTYKKMVLIHEDKSLQHLEHDWNKLVVKKGADLVHVLKTIDFELHVEEPYFSQLKDGLKTIEGRCAVGDYNSIRSGDLILFNRCLVLKVQDLRRYASFSEMLVAEGLAKVLPGVQTIEEGVQVYRKFYTQDKERSNGVLAIGIGEPAAQLYASLAGILSVLSYEGIQRLLGLVHTVGTDSEALTPPRSALLSSFMLPLKHNVQGGILTEGARALAKHVNRSSNKYWGSFDGSESNKNRRALDVVNHFIDHCCWLNLHIVPPHGTVFEIRVTEGYGARWSKDGQQFIGFVEPYLEGGYSKGWKH